MRQGFASCGETAAEEHAGMFDEAVEDFGDEKGGGEIDQQESADGDAAKQGVDENEESGSVNEVEAVRDLAEVVDRAGG